MRTPDASFLFNAFFTASSAKTMFKEGKSRTAEPSLLLPLPFLEFWMSWSATRFATSTGMAKPTPTFCPVLVKMAALTPINLPSAETSSPPLFPGLIAASVCSAPETNELGKVSTERFLPEIIPVVNV